MVIVVQEGKGLRGVDLKLLEGKLELGRGWELVLSMKHGRRRLLGCNLGDVGHVKFVISNGDAFS